MSPVLSVEDLRIESLSGLAVVDAVSLDVRAGEAFGLVGESGSGKTTTALAVLGWVRPGLRLVRGSIKVDGEEVLGRRERDLRRLRGRLVAYVPQNAGAALNPSLRVGRQIVEVLRHRTKNRGRNVVGDVLELVNLPGDRKFQRRFPHQLSGGQLQRLALGVALAARPKVLVLDEPTTGLDVVTQQLVLDEVDRIRAELGVAIVSISHDLALVAARTDRLAVMMGGKVVERGPSRLLLAKPADDYTKALVDAVPDPRRIRHAGPSAAPPLNGAIGKHVNGVSAPSPAERPLLTVEQLRAIHKTRHGTVVAAEDVSFAVERGGCLALVGESGSGKTTIARCVVGLHKPENGSIRLDDAALAAIAPKRTLQQRRRIQIVFQDPFDSLNPRTSVHDAIARPVRKLGGFTRVDANGEVSRLLERVRLPARLAAAYPTELSGGECQRVAIARALAAKPELLVCDEITSALDTSVQASVLELIEELRADLGLALLFISHDLGVVASVADRVVVLERGIACEHGAAVDVLTSPSHPYTQKLLGAAPSLSAALAAGERADALSISASSPAPRPT
jgi:peptide/nickel transport system ATP-binding protein